MQRVSYVNSAWYVGSCHLQFPFTDFYRYLIIPHKQPAIARRLTETARS